MLTLHSLSTLLAFHLVGPSEKGRMCDHSMVFVAARLLRSESGALITSRGSVRAGAVRSILLGLHELLEPVKSLLFAAGRAHRSFQWFVCAGGPGFEQLWRRLEAQDMCSPVCLLDLGGQLRLP